MIVSDFIVSYQPKVKLKDLPKITSADEAEAIFRQKWNDSIGFKESFYVMHLNRGNKPLGVYCVGIGSATEVIVDQAEITRNALLGGARHVIVAHNHPSGNLTPSSSDDNITAKVAEALKAVGLELTDHIILHPEEGSYSYRLDCKL